MAKISLVTITGADDKTDISDLIAMHSLYPFVEWGILFSSARVGTPRYPLMSKIMKIAEKKMPLSAHLCGQFARDVLEKQDFKVIHNLPEAFQRVQLNYNFDRSTDWRIKPLIDYAESNPDRAIIIQWNKSNQKWLYAFVEDGLFPANIHFLYDSSGGRGVSIKNIQEPLPNYTGYSGGIHPNNIEEIIKGITELNNDRDVWIDMESGIRTEDEFDIEKVREVLHAVSRSIRPELHQ